MNLRFISEFHNYEIYTLILCPRFNYYHKHSISRTSYIGPAINILESQENRFFKQLHISSTSLAVDFDLQAEPPLCIQWMRPALSPCPCTTCPLLILACITDGPCLCPTWLPLILACMAGGARSCQTAKRKLLSLQLVSHVRGERRQVSRLCQFRDYTHR